ncbi:MAG: hypothetical protein P0Y49_17755 [Candidatus Pedobacter colombiensis]|uniref:Beta-lactamase-inhibitor-like PepSY-like domain-containing protein n=1 Tax=Candidatus Pedobacter colombiensis TaxID=3121371 RepID=A0AAJ5W5U0_9SPHI|nr:hypothetical protein [Pedobacter sp.]WEK18636.1 MAG: hypothetical protein P0Y49_17755 [Pedobacter sp.]
MKKATILIAGLAGLTISASAQKLAASNVPGAVKMAFAKAHPEVKTVTWEKEENDFEAGFKLKDQEVSEIYSASGKMRESEVEIKTTELPAPITSYIAGHYKKAKIKGAAKITKADGTVVYEAVINGKDHLFDAKGNPVK